VYAPQLENIVGRLKTFAASTGAKLLFGITSPMLDSVTADNDVMELNRRAVAIMAASNVRERLSYRIALTVVCGAFMRPRCAGRSRTQVFLMAVR
jgi:hypothetical protein